MKNLKLASAGVLALLLLTGCGGKSDKASAAKSDHQPKTTQSAKQKTSTKTSSSSTSESSSTSTNSSSSSDNEKTATSGSSATKSSTTTGAAQTGSGKTASDFDALAPHDRYKLYAAWLDNSQGQFAIYAADSATTYVINEGPNGTKLYKDGQQVGDSYAGISLAREKNSAKFVIDGDAVDFYVPGDSDLDGNFSHLTWSKKASLTKSQLMSQYYQASQSNDQIVQTSAGQP